ncbi:aminopeptidase P family protein [Labilibaculum antarcticum]|uniref:Xaa-Pro aminopeptidase n=1 Tax=Labilibaculum antarcticum TaxID=1717717 RepID=A0A1Y1CN42_9BACT|nr:aminopeptidase P family protein [Labilibaculum antarcticum]BAX81859.1 Xaa-Pro aminopeptidase [Labilibaculum antarcticum]
MTFANRVNALRSLLHEKNIHAYIITSSDPHMSEYVPDRWSTRQWLSGFTGSAGTLVVTQEKAGLWTDSRYFLQAETQLAGSGIKLFRMGTAGTPTQNEWLSDELPIKPNVGFDGTCFSVAQTRELKHKLGDLGINIEEEFDLVNEIWENRPELPTKPIYDHEVCYSGQTRYSKLLNIRKQMEEFECNFHFVGSLDDVAWIFNIRGNDVDYNPLALAYAIIGVESATLYLNEGQISNELIQKLAEDEIYIADYTRVFNDLSEIAGSSNVLLDSNRTNLNIFNSISANIIERENPSQLLKSLKNEVEIEGMKNAMKKDGVALTHFYYWLEENIDKTKITEFTVMDKLKEFRSLQKDFKGESFGTIAGYKDHGAHPHYSTTPESNVEIKRESLLLIDSGAQYLDGTTDITRTIPLGELNEEEKTDFTLVLKGMIQLALAKFPRGTRGCNLDILARQALWKSGKDYGHGTGHGVGCFMNVHEGPQSIRQEIKDQALLPGMITSDEPGFYREGFYGIRHENLILCCPEKTTQFGEFLNFETITLCHFETKGIITKLLTPEEREWLNNYHEKVYEIISPELDDKHKNWLKEKTKTI